MRRRKKLDDVAEAIAADQPGGEEETEEEGAAPSSGSPEDSDPPKKRRGRPPGPRKPRQPEVDPAVLEAVFDATLRDAARLPCLVWKLEPLSEEEAATVSAVTKPVLVKYLGDWMMAWGAEAMCLIVIFKVYGPRFASRPKMADSGRVRDGQNVVGPDVDSTLNPASGS